MVISRLASPLLALMFTLAMLWPQRVEAQSRFLAPVDQYEPRQNRPHAAELTSIAGHYRRTNIANCDEAYGPLSAEDMRSLLFYRQATFERFRWNSQSKGEAYTWYISEGSDEQYLCGGGKVYCGPLYVCRSGSVRLVRGSDRLVALGERFREMDIGVGVAFRFKTCNQSISKFRHVEVLLKNPTHIRNMANSGFATRILASAVHFADRICHNDGWTYTYPNVRSDLKDKSGFYDPYANIEVAVIDGTKPYDPRGAPLLRIRTQTSSQPGVIRVGEFSGGRGVLRIAGFALPDLSTLTAQPDVASSTSSGLTPVAIKPAAGGVVWGVPARKDFELPPGSVDRRAKGTPLWG